MSFHFVTYRLSLTQSKRWLCVWFLFCILSRTVQDLGFYPTFTLQINLLLDADRRHEVSGSETKDFITSGKSNSQSFICLCQLVSPPYPTAVTQGLIMNARTCNWLHYTKETLSSGMSTTFIVSGNKPAHFLRRDVNSPLCANTALKNILGKEA